MGLIIYHVPELVWLKIFIWLLLSSENADPYDHCIAFGSSLNMPACTGPLNKRLVVQQILVSES